MMMSVLRKSTVRPLPVREAAVVEHLQQDVEHVRMRLLDLVEQHHLIGPAAHRFGERAALLVAHIAGRRADEPGDRVLLHVFRHVEAHQRRLVVEQERRQRLGQLGLADACGAEEHERAHRPVRILQAGAGAAHRGRDRVHGLAPGRRRASPDPAPCAAASRARLRASYRPARRSSATRPAPRGRASPPLPSCRRHRLCASTSASSFSSPGMTP